VVSRFFGVYGMHTLLSKDKHWEFGSRLDWIGFDSIRFDSIGLDWNRFDSIGLDSIGLDWIRFDWIRFDSIRLAPVFFPCVWVVSDLQISHAHVCPGL